MSICDFPDDARERLLAMSGPRMWEAPMTPDPESCPNETGARDPDTVARVVALQRNAQ